jgi:hypothetical protein
MRMIDYLLDNYDTNADARWLVDYHDIWLMPEVNPDGHHIVEAGAMATALLLSQRTATTSEARVPWPPHTI